VPSRIQSRSPSRPARVSLLLTTPCRLLSLSPVAAALPPLLPSVISQYAGPRAMPPPGSHHPSHITQECWASPQQVVARKPLFPTIGLDLDHTTFALSSSWPHLLRLQIHLHPPTSTHQICTSTPPLTKSLVIASRCVLICQWLLLAYHQIPFSSFILNLPDGELTSLERIYAFKLDPLTWKRSKAAPGTFYLISPFIGCATSVILTTCVDGQVSLLKSFINEHKPRKLLRRSQRTNDV
jgi:hypothetical protein